MVKAARELTGHAVRQMRFQEVDWAHSFDGIWTCASLLHVSKAEMNDVWRRLVKALKPGGIWYMSFKSGAGEGIRRGRFFNVYDEFTLRTLVVDHQLDELRI
jgi:hypothetical protein